MDSRHGIQTNMPTCRKIDKYSDMHTPTVVDNETYVDRHIDAPLFMCVMLNIYAEICN